MKTKYKANKILLWTKNKDIIKFIMEISKEFDLGVDHVKNDTDIIASTFFLLIVDAENLKDKILHDFNQIAKMPDKSECSLIVVGKKLKDIPEYVKRLMSYAPKVITKEYLTEKVKSMLMSVKAIKKDNFNDKLHRIIFIYKTLYDGTKLRTETLCDLFGVGERTIRRDIRALKEVCDEEIIHEKDLNGYYYYYYLNF